MTQHLIIVLRRCVALVQNYKKNYVTSINNSYNGHDKRPNVNVVDFTAPPPSSDFDSSCHTHKFTIALKLYSFF